MYQANAKKCIKQAQERYHAIHASDDEGSNSDSLAESERAPGPESDIEYGISLKDIKGAGHTIACCCNMFCDVNKAVHLVILSKQEEQGENTSTLQVLTRYKKVYYTLIYEIPSIKTLIEDSSHASILKTMLKKINEAISKIRSSDSARLCEKLLMYILQNPKINTMKPAINSSTSKLELGLNHIQLTGYLCPVESVKAFSENAEETRKELENRKIDMSVSKLPAFLWENNGTKYDEEDIYSGLFHGFYLERVARHIFTGPSMAHGGDSCAVHSCNAVLHCMDKVEAVHIAYAVVLARFGISSQSRWSEKDSRFNYQKFYYITQDVINECKDIEWKQGLLKYYNMLFFQNEEGWGGDFMAMDDESTLNSTSKSGGFLNHMQVQAAACAGHIIKPPAIPINHPPHRSSTSQAPTTDSEAVMTPVVHEPSQEPMSEQPPSPFISVQARRASDPVPVTTTLTDRSLLEPVSELSEIEPDLEQVSKLPANKKKKSFAPKGKCHDTGQGSEGGPSKCRSGWKKAGNNA